MKYLSIALIILMTISVKAQEVNKKNKKLFIRIYNIEGNLIAKGDLLHVADTYILLMKNNKRIEVPVLNLGLIKTKHTKGHSVLVGASIGATIGAILGIVTSSSDPDAFLGYTAGEGALIFGVVGASLGTLTGAISGSVKPKKTFIINGDTKKYNEFKVAMGF